MSVKLLFVYSVHAITSKINPIAAQQSPAQLAMNKGLELLETDTFKLYCLQTVTGLKIVVTGDCASQLDNVPAKIYGIYSDYVMKNPFYTPEMPIRCEQFDLQISLMLQAINVK